MRCTSHVPLSGTTGTSAAVITASSTFFVRPVTATLLLILRLLSLVLLLVLMSMAFALAFASGVLTFALASVSLLGPRGMATLAGAGAAFAVGRSGRRGTLAGPRATATSLIAARPWAHPAIVIRSGRRGSWRPLRRTLCLCVRRAFG